MTETSGSEIISTKLRRIAELARTHRDWAFSTLAHHIDIDWLREAHRRTRKDAAVGVDGETAADFEANLEENLEGLLEALKSGRYYAPPVRRVEIPKPGGKSRPIGIPTHRDKVLQRAVVMVLEVIYEQDFLDCSYGFRRGRSAHDALEALRKAFMSMGGGWVLEVDVQSFFDTLDHRQLRSFLDKRVTDGVLRRVIHKWLKAGVMKDGAVRHPDTGTPQGGVISPLLANVYLHEVLDKWFEGIVKPRLRGRSFLIRYADDFVLVFAREDEARKVMRVLPKRFAKYGLTLHPTKTRLVRFEPPRHGGKGGGDRGEPHTFDLLGFTHYWGRSRGGGWFVKKKTAKNRLSRALVRIAEWCRKSRNLRLREQHATLCRKVRGHYNYYGVTGNIRSLKRFEQRVERIWCKWLTRRSQRSRMTWERFSRLLREVFPLPPVRVVRSAYRLPAKP